MSHEIMNYLVLPMPVLWLMVLALVLWRWRRLSRRLFVLATLILAVACLPITGRILLQPLAAGIETEAVVLEQKASAILVPTAGSFQDPTGQWRANPMTISRALTGLALQKHLGIPVILAGGTPYDGEAPDSLVLANDLGLEDANIRFETSARNSDETGAAMLSDQPDAAVILVTSPSHVARMSASLRHHGLGVVAAPLGIPPATAARKPRGLGEFVPSDRGLKASRAALWEYMGIGWYLVTGRLDWGDLWPAAGSGQ